MWNLANETLQKPGYTTRGLIAMSNVETICTTDDPVDTLEYHQKLLADKSFKTNVLPAWRPDKAVNIEKPDFMAYIAKLEKAAEMEIHTFADLKAALEKRMAYFHENNCRLSDHGLNYVVYEPADDAAIEAIFAKKAAGETLTDTEVAQFKTAMLLFCAAQYKKLNWTMQLHYGCRRDNNRVMFEKLGPDTGYDTINNYTPVDQMAVFLGAVESASGLPRTILYSLNPADDQAIDTLCGCFQSSEAVSKMQHGSAWWFNDHFTGMTNQLTSLANLGYLAGFVHADRQPLLPVLSAPRVFPPHPVPSAGRMGGGWPLPAGLRHPRRNRPRHLLRQRAQVFRVPDEVRGAMSFRHDIA